MNRKLFTTAVALLAAGALQAQTLNVVVGSVTYQVPAAQAGEMVYQDGQTVSIMNKTYTLADVDQMYIDNTAVTDYTVQVEYSGTTAQVKVAGNVAKYVDVSVSGAHVGIVQSEPDAEITYTLSGTATDGEFYLEGDYKKSRELQLKYLDLIHALFVEVNPIPVKEAMNIMGLNAGTYRMPLCEMDPANREKLMAAMRKVGLCE